MPVNRNYALPGSGEPVGGFTDRDGIEYEVDLSREYYRWFALIDVLLGEGGPLWDLEEEHEVLVLKVEQQDAKIMALEDRLTAAGI